MRPRQLEPKLPVEIFAWIIQGEVTSREVNPVTGKPSVQL